MSKNGKFINSLISLRDKVLLSRVAFGDHKVFSRNISRFIKPEKSGQALVQLSLVADCLRAFVHISKNGAISEEQRADVCLLLRAIGTVRSEYREFGDMSDHYLDDAFSYYKSDTDLFGFRDERAMWSGLETCSNADRLEEEDTRLRGYRSLIADWLGTCEPEFKPMEMPGFRAMYAKCCGPNVQLRPNVICKNLQYGDETNQTTELNVRSIAPRLAYWELLELTRENGLQFSRFLREPSNLTSRQRLELDCFLDCGPRVRHLWPEESRDRFKPFPKSEAINPFADPRLRPGGAVPSKGEQPGDSGDVTVEPGHPSGSPQPGAGDTSQSNSVLPKRTRGKSKEPAISAEEEKRRVIDAPLDSNHLIFAPPGTGKTYALVKRLAKLISGGHIENPSRDTLIVSFSRAAVAEIIKRMDAEADETGDNNLRYVQIRTFDSYATRMMTLGDSDITIANGYSKRIDQFSRLLGERRLTEDAIERIEEIRLLVIDEIQDLVGDRARMALALIGHVAANGGSVLLLGDPAQAIYDWQLNDGDEMTSAEFVRKSKSLLDNVGNGFQQRTFAHYHRFENQELLDFVQACRRAIGEDGESPDMTGLRNELNRFGSTIPEERLSTESNSIHSVAVLTRTNLEAFQLSQWCDEKAINHRVERGASGRYWPGWIARLCYGFEGQQMSEQMLKRRWDKLVSESEWGDLATALAYLADHGVYQNQQLDIERLSSLIEKSQPQTHWPPGDDCGLTISTIHRSKGLEFDRVALLEPQAENFSGGDRSNDNENARIIYVAATRAKNQLLRLARNRAIFKKGYKRCARRISSPKLEHFRLWDPGNKTSSLLLDGMDEFDLDDYMKTVKSPSRDETQNSIWSSRSPTSDLEIVPCDSTWKWRLNGADLCCVSPNLERTLAAYNSYLSYSFKTEIDSLIRVPVVDVATVSFAWRGDREVERALGKARLALLPVVYGLARVKQAMTPPTAEAGEEKRHAQG